MSRREKFLILLMWSASFLLLIQISLTLTQLVKVLRTIYEALCASALA